MSKIKYLAYMVVVLTTAVTLYVQLAQQNVINKYFFSNYGNKINKYVWKQINIDEIEQIPTSSINALIDQNAKYIEVKKQIIEPIATVELVYYSLAQLIENYGSNINKNNEMHTCPMVSSCKTSVLLHDKNDNIDTVNKWQSVRSIRKRPANKYLKKCLINMVSHCGRVRNHISQKYFHVLNDDRNTDSFHKILLCGEGGYRTNTFINEVNRYDVAMLFDTRPFSSRSSQVTTELIYFNPHIRDGVEHIMKYYQHDLKPPTANNFDDKDYPETREYLIGIFISNCNTQLARNNFIHALMALNNYDDEIAEYTVKSFGKCFPVKYGIRTNINVFLKSMKATEKTISNSWHAKKIHALKFFKFTVAMENTINIPFYITEKIFDAFKAGSLPIYYGPDEIYLFVPNHSIINAKKFENDAIGLTNYIKYLNENKTAYNEYFVWKEPGHPSMDEYRNRPWIKSGFTTDNWQCRLCMWLSTL
jgi:hypothetical protein